MLAVQPAQQLGTFDGFGHKMEVLWFTNQFRVPLLQQANYPLPKGLFELPQFCRCTR